MASCFWRRIRLVLNDHRKADPADQIVVAVESDEGLLEDEGYGRELNRWTINWAALERPSAYLGIIGAPA
jgi:5-methylcytosine-specific restriction protein B